MKSEVKAIDYGFGIFVDGLDTLTATVYFGEKEACKTKYEAEGVANMLKELFELGHRDKVLKLSVVDPKEKTTDWTKQPDLMNGDGCSDCKNVLYCRDRLGECQKNLKGVLLEISEYLSNQLTKAMKSDLDKPKKQLLPEVNDEISKWLQWRIDRRKALLEVATQIFAMYSDAKDLPSLAALSSPEKRHYIQYAVNAAAILIDEIEAKVNMDEKVKTSAGK